MFIVYKLEHLDCRQCTIQSLLSKKKSTNSLKLILSLDFMPAILTMVFTSSSLICSPSRLNTSLRSSVLIYPFLYRLTQLETNKQKNTYFCLSNIENAKTKQFSAICLSEQESLMTFMNSSNYRDSLPLGNSSTVGVLELVIYYELLPALPQLFGTYWPPISWLYDELVGTPRLFILFLAGLSSGSPSWPSELWLVFYSLLFLCPGPPFNLTLRLPQGLIIWLSILLLVFQEELDCIWCSYNMLLLVLPLLIPAYPFS